MKIIAFSNQKGGAGKTTSALNAAAALSELGNRVLLVDLDQQANLTESLIPTDADELEKTVYQLISKSLSLQDVLIKNVMSASGIDGVDLVPSNIDLAMAELELVSVNGRERRLHRTLLYDLKGEQNQLPYDYILIDCPPSLGILNTNAMMAADHVVVPVKSHYFSLRGLKRLISIIDSLKEDLGKELTYSLLLTIVRLNKKNHQESVQLVREQFGDLVHTPLIPDNVKAEESPIEFQSVITYAPTSPAASAYRGFAQELVSK